MGAVFRHRESAATAYAIASHRCLRLLQWTMALGLLVFIALAASQVVFAASSNNLDKARSDHSAQLESPAPNHAAPQLSPLEAADQARDKYGGHVLNVVLEHDSSGPYYRVKLLDKGRVRVTHVSARQ